MFCISRELISIGNLLLADWVSTQPQAQRERNAVRVSAAVGGARVG